jgi:putative membrane protein
MWHGYYYVGGWPMFLGGLLFFGSLIALIVWAVHRITDRRDGGTDRAKTPLDYLKERYARGEITKEEFDRIKRDLST